MKKTGSATNSNWPGPPPGQQRDCALKARWPPRTRSLCIRIWAAAHGLRLGFSASDRRSTPRPGEYVGSGPIGPTFPSIGWKSRNVVGCQPKPADERLGIVLSGVPAPAATPAAITAINAAPLSSDVLNIACSSVVAIRGPDVGRHGALSGNMPFISQRPRRANGALSGTGRFNEVERYARTPG